MTHRPTALENALHDLRERNKELNCLYQVESLLTRTALNLTDALPQLAAFIEEAMQFPDECRVRLRLTGKEYVSGGFKCYDGIIFQPILLQGVQIGDIAVCYANLVQGNTQDEFLFEERKLVMAIADLIGYFESRDAAGDLSDREVAAAERGRANWRVVVNILNTIDQDLFLRISRKMINYLSWRGVSEADPVLQRFGLDRSSRGSFSESGQNQPMGLDRIDGRKLGEEVFEVAARNLSMEETVACLERWMFEDKVNFLVRALLNPASTHDDAREALVNYRRLAPTGPGLSEATRKSITVALINRFLSTQLEFIKIAKNFLDIDDFYALIQKLIYSPGSRGPLGGKGAGLFLASKVLERLGQSIPELKGIKVPRTWYVTTDGLYNFLHYNNMEEITEQKYKNIEQVQQEYPNIVHTFKNSAMPAEIVTGLARTLDEIGEHPLIVRSSSLLEDSFGASFSGKYKSLFLANQGSKAHRLEALIDAVVEVYASIYASDPIQYRAERGLLDFNEEMGVLIQEVVGTPVGSYFLPTYAGVAFSHNEFRWSPRIRREDGLVRLVLGLGTRAVDRLGDDYCILASPGQPSLLANASIEEQIRYSPCCLDLINLSNNRFETHILRDFLREHGSDLPRVEEMISVVSDGMTRGASLLGIDFKQDNLLVTGDGLLRRSSFLNKIKLILQKLEESFGTPVDIEFASDGTDFYLLQCRPQGKGSETIPVQIPSDLKNRDVIFTATKYVSSGRVQDVSYIVYVSPEEYSELSSLEDMLDVGTAVGKLNNILPKRQFILMGPGRWGSRGDVKLGVSITYADINNTAMLIEIGRKKGGYTPELSFGTHFFQDLVEAKIRYLPLYPDEEGIIFNQRFLETSENHLSRFLPECSHIDKVLRVIDVDLETKGMTLQVSMNADQCEAVGFLETPEGKKRPTSWL